MNYEKWRSVYKPSTLTPIIPEGLGLYIVNAVAMVRPFCIWTVVTTPQGQSIRQGYHFEKSVGVYVTEVPWQHGTHSEIPL